MSDDAPEKSGKVWLWMTAAVLMAPVAYVLMAGPVVVLHKRGLLPVKPVVLIYGSFDQALQNTPLVPAWEGYLNAWLSATGTSK